MMNCEFLSKMTYADDRYTAAMGNYELLVRGIMDLPNQPAIINLQYVLMLTVGLSFPSSFPPIARNFLPSPSYWHTAPEVICCPNSFSPTPHMRRADRQYLRPNVPPNSSRRRYGVPSFWRLLHQSTDDVALRNQSILRYPNHLSPRSIPTRYLGRYYIGQRVFRGWEWRS